MLFARSLELSLRDQSADWCGNPPVRGEMYRQLPYRAENIAFLVVIVTWFHGAGGLPRQCAHWLAMTAFYLACKRKQQFIFPKNFPHLYNKSVLLYRTVCILSSETKHERLMTMYSMRYVQGHVQVYDKTGKFLFSADTEREAREELEDYAESAA